MSEKRNRGCKQCFMLTAPLRYSLKPLGFQLARPEGFEPPAYRFVV